jgi:hypothetical protein
MGEIWKEGFVSKVEDDDADDEDKIDDDEDKIDDDVP